jgi:hypothetical protein
MMGARGVNLLHKFIYKQTLPDIISRMPPGDWKQWAKKWPFWIQEDIKEAFWRFVDQKWKDSLNVHCSFCRALKGR